MQHDITNAQIRRFAAESWEAGDSLAAAVCVVALDELDETEYALDVTDHTYVRGMTPDEARADVAQMIALGAAQ